jgi:two-component system, LytTR family, response regulator
MIRVCVIDDEPIACRKIQRMLKDDPEIETVGVCSNGEEARQAIENLLPDLIFLDVQMPEMDGFEVLKSLNVEKMPHIIFVTAYDHYAIRAFEVHALDYLLKPFDRKRFQEALNHGKTQISQDRNRSNKSELKALLEEIKSAPRYLERLVIKNQGKVFFLKTDAIDWIEAQGKYELVHAGQDSHLIREGMGKLESELDPKKFVRIHKSTIVNIDRIEHLQPLFHGDFKAFLRNGTALTVSRRHREKLEKFLGKSL